MVVEKEAPEDESFRIGRTVLATTRLQMRPLREADLPELVPLANNFHVAQMLARMPHPYGEREGRAFLALARMQPAGMNYALTLAENGAFIGCAGFNATGSGPEIGYWIGEPYWGRGYATEAAHALVDLAFRETPLPVLHASTRVVNPGSRRVIQKCGFQYAGQGLMNSLATGQVPIERYRLDRKTWASLRSWAAT